MCTRAIPCWGIYRQSLVLDFLGLTYLPGASLKFNIVSWLSGADLNSGSGSDNRDVSRSRPRTRTGAAKHIPRGTVEATSELTVAHNRGLRSTIAGYNRGIATIITVNSH